MLPPGLRFDHKVKELMEHLEAKVRDNMARFHHLIDCFIPTIVFKERICYTHLERLLG